MFINPLHFHTQPIPTHSGALYKFFNLSQWWMTYKEHISTIMFKNFYSYRFWRSTWEFLCSRWGSVPDPVASPVFQYNDPSSHAGDEDDESRAPYNHDRCCDACSQSTSPRAPWWMMRWRKMQWYQHRLQKMNNMYEMSPIHIIIKMSAIIIIIIFF